MRILLVDDWDLVREMYASILTMCGDEIDTACDGSEALELMKRSHYDVLITDNNMPNMTGEELIKRVRDRFEHIIMISAYEQKDIKMDLKDILYLQKPIDLRTLRGILCEIRMEKDEYSFRCNGCKRFCRIGDEDSE